MYCSDLGLAVALYDKSHDVRPDLIGDFVESSSTNKPILVSGIGTHEIVYEYSIDYHYNWPNMPPTFVFTMDDYEQKITLSRSLKYAMCNNKQLLLSRHAPILIVFSEDGAMAVYNEDSFQKQFAISLKGTFHDHGKVAITLLHNKLPAPDDVNQLNEEKSVEKEENSIKPNQ